MCQTDRPVHLHTDCTVLQVTSFSWLDSHHSHSINLTENISLKVQLVYYKKISPSLQVPITASTLVGLKMNRHLERARYHWHFFTFIILYSFGCFEWLCRKYQEYKSYFGSNEWIQLLPMTIIIIICYHGYWILDFVARISTASVVLVQTVINLREENRDVLRWECINAAFITVHPAVFELKTADRWRRMDGNLPLFTRIVRRAC